MTDKLMTIREMAETFEVTPRTLRFYESKELLFPIRRGQTRWFTKRCRARLKLILRGKRFGFSLEDIRQLLDMYEGKGSEFKQLTHAYRVALTRLEEMRQQRLELEQAIEELREEMTWASKRLSSELPEMISVDSLQPKETLNRASL